MRTPSAFTKFLAVPLLVLLLSACSMFSGRESAGEYVDDTTITSKVKTAIIGDPDLKVFQINVETMQGIVQLSGFVDSWAHKNKAEEIARNTEGVKLVKDSLVIKK